MSQFWYIKPLPRELILYLVLSLSTTLKQAKTGKRRSQVYAVATQLSYFPRGLLSHLMSVFCLLVCIL